MTTHYYYTYIKTIITILKTGPLAGLAIKPVTGITAIIKQCKKAIRDKSFRLRVIIIIIRLFNDGVKIHVYV
jgi:hypothetical protein